MAVGGKREGAGRKPARIDPALLRNLAGIGATWIEIEAVMGVCEDSIRNRMKVDKGLARQYREGRGEGAVTLRRLQWHQAEAGNPTMLIWLGKQLLGQRDNLDQKLSGNVSITVESGVPRSVGRPDDDPS